MDDKILVKEFSTALKYAHKHYKEAKKANDKKRIAEIYIPCMMLGSMWVELIKDMETELGIGGK